MAEINSTAVEKRAQELAKLDGEAWQRAGGKRSRNSLDETGRAHYRADN